MKSRDLIRWALNLTSEGTLRLVDDMRNAPLTAPTAGGNHSLWTMGHLAFIEGSIPQILYGEPNPVEHWKSMFGPGSDPKSDAGVYPPFDEVLATYHELRTKNLKRLDELSEVDLDRAPQAIPPGFEDAMQTVGQTLLLTSLHNMVHYGQIADARRAAGRKSLL